MTAAVEIEDKGGNKMLVTRTKCVTVENDPKRHLEAVQLDFDFSDLSIPELEECGMVRVQVLSPIPFSLSVRFRLDFCCISGTQDINKS